MAIRPRLKPTAAPAPVEIDESAIAAVINRGGAPAGADAAPSPPPAPEPATTADPEKKFTLRLSASLLAEIERDAKGRPDRISVNTWLIGAALQRLGKS